MDRTAIRVAVTSDAPPGAYTVAYRVVSQDGHPITSTFGYTVAGDVPAVDAAASPIASLASASPAVATCQRLPGQRVPEQRARQRPALRPHRRRAAGPDPDRRRSDSLAEMTTTENATTPDLWPAPTATGPVDAVVPVPGSKSASNRALVLAAIADGPSTITGLLDARDTQLMMAGLRLLGNEVHVVDHDAVGNVTVDVTPHFMRGPATIDVGLAGTVMRFLPPAACLAHGEITFDGDAHSRRRPMATVIESLKDLGVTIHDRGTGRLPFMIEATGEVTGGEVFVNASKSSQFISGLLISAARFNAGVTIHHVGDPVPSMPHIQMTIAMLAEQGVPVRFDGDSVWHVDPQELRALDRHIEPDLSNAAPFLAAAMITEGRVRDPRLAHRHDPGRRRPSGPARRGWAPTSS